MMRILYIRVKQFERRTGVLRRINTSGRERDGSTEVGERENYNDNWIWYSPEHKRAKRNPTKGREDHDDGPAASARISPTVGSVPRGETDDRSNVNGETSLLNFGSYHDWTYGEIMTNVPNYATYICHESMESSPEQQFQEWITLKAYDDENEAWEGQNPKHPTK